MSELGRPALFAGVDGGGSKTLAVVVDAEGRERGRATAGSSNYTVVGLDRAVAHIREAVSGAAQAASAEPPVCAAWIGLAGVDRPGARDMLLPHLRPLAGDVTLGNDAELVLGALNHAVGVAIIAGSGSIVLGRDATGRTTRAGGWGHLIGDEGSGYEIGRAALQAAARAADGRGPATALLDAFLRHWNLADPIDMIAHVYGDAEKPRIAGLASLVFAAARAGDRAASKIVAAAAGELALAATAVGDRLAFPDGRMPLALAGGLLTGQAAFRQMVLGRVRRRRPVGQVLLVEEPALSAAQGLVRRLGADRVA